VYVPTEDELLFERKNDINKSNKNVYKMISCTEGECHFIPCQIATPMLKNIELGSNNKSERAWNGQMIKQVCIKLKVDRLGNISI